MKTGHEINIDIIFCSYKDEDRLENQKWYSEDEIRNTINELIRWADKRQKDNTLYRIECEELQNDWLTALNVVKEHLGISEGETNGTSIHKKIK